MHAKSLQLCPTLFNPTDCSPPGSSVHGISQARILEWLPFPSPGGLPNRGIKSTSLMCPILAGGFFPTSATWEAQGKCINTINTAIPAFIFPGTLVHRIPSLSWVLVWRRKSLIMFTSSIHLPAPWGAPTGSHSSLHFPTHPPTSAEAPGFGPQ